jgi:hypothetical protein
MFSQDLHRINIREATENVLKFSRCNICFRVKGIVLFTQEIFFFFSIFCTPCVPVCLLRGKARQRYGIGVSNTFCLFVPSNI